MGFHDNAEFDSPDRRVSEEVFADLAFDFRSASSTEEGSKKFDVLEAMRKDGLRPLAVSVNVDRANCRQNGERVPCADDDKGDCSVVTDNDPESPQRLATDNDPESPQRLATDNDPESPQRLATDNDPESPQRLATDNDPESPQRLATDNNPKSPRRVATDINNPKSPLFVATYNDPKSPQRVATDNDPKSPEHVELGETLIVPNVVHYIYFSNNVDHPRWNLTFLHYLSFRSASRFIKPDQIFVYGNKVPTGHWWNVTIHEVRNIYHVKMPLRKTALNGKRLLWIQHSSNIIRLQMTLQYGGIYLDNDVLVLKSFDPLRRYPTVLGAEFPNRLNNGVIVARRGSAFLRLMLEQYHSYDDGQKEEFRLAKGVQQPKILAKIFPHLVHVEERSLHPTSKAEETQIYEGNFDWRRNYALHLFSGNWALSKKPSRVEDILTLNTTMGEMARYILFCSTKIRQ